MCLGSMRRMREIGEKRGAKIRATKRKSEKAERRETESGKGENERWKRRKACGIEAEKDENKDKDYYNDKR